MADQVEKSENCFMAVFFFNKDSSTETVTITLFKREFFLI